MNKLLKEFGITYEYTHDIRSITPEECKLLGREASYRRQVGVYLYIQHESRDSYNNRIITGINPIWVYKKVIYA